jgi:hypothetical protein
LLSIWVNLYRYSEAALDKFPKAAPKPPPPSVVGCGAAPGGSGGEGGEGGSGGGAGAEGAEGGGEGEAADAGNGWMEGMMKAAADGAAKLADSAAAAVAAAAESLGIAGEENPDREARARADTLELIKALVDAGADMNAPMQVCRPLVSDLVVSTAYPLGIAMGLYVDGLLPEALEAVKKLIEAGANVNGCRGVGPFPLVSTPLFSAGLYKHNPVVTRSLNAAWFQPSSP